MENFLPSPFIHCVVAGRGGGGRGDPPSTLILGNGEMGKWNKNGSPVVYRTRGRIGC
jgi:hypothetical protein